MSPYEKRHMAKPTLAWIDVQLERSGHGPIQQRSEVATD